MQQSDRKKSTHTSTYTSNRKNFILTMTGAGGCVLYLIGRAGGQDELAVGIEAQTVDLGGVSVHRVARFGRVVRAGVPSEDGWRRVRASRFDRTVRNNHHL